MRTRQVELRDAILAHLPGQCVTAVDHDLRYIYAAGQLLDAFEMTSASVVGRTVIEVAGEKYGAALEGNYRLALDGHQLTQRDREFRGSYLEQSFFPLYIYSEGPGVVGACSIIRDVTHRVRNQMQLQELATTDALTLLGNRRAFDEALPKKILALTSLLVLDLNGFKALNDTEGHDAGDRALREVSEILVSSTRPTDTRARIGGDEFAVILPGAGATEALAVASRVRMAIDNMVPGVSAAIGIATCPLDSSDPIVLKAMADSRMYADKRLTKAMR